MVAVKFPLGRYGDNHVTPNLLFDPRDPAAAPPPETYSGGPARWK